MGYTLQPLLRIRTMREDRATGELTAARQALSAAEEALEERRRELAEYEASEGVARIDEEGALKVDNVSRAEAERKAREEAAEAARENLNVATKNRMKIEEHRATWLADDAKAQDARAEGELEDFTVRKEEI